MTNTSYLEPMIKMPTLPDNYHDLAQQAERDLLGLLMLWGNVESMNIEPSWFSNYQHLITYYALVAASELHSRSDVVTVSEELDMAGLLEHAGGLQYLARLAKDSPNLKPWQITPILRGFALMRYSMAPKEGTKIVVRLDDAIINGWLHGKAWLTTREKLETKGIDNVCDLRDEELAWVCFAYLTPDFPPESHAPAQGN